MSTNPGISQLQKGAGPAILFTAEADAAELSCGAAHPSGENSSNTHFSKAERERNSRNSRRVRSIVVVERNNGWAANPVPDDKLSASRKSKVVFVPLQQVRRRSNPARDNAATLRLYRAKTRGSVSSNSTAGVSHPQ